MSRHTFLCAMDRKLLGVACQSLELAFLSEWKPSFHLKTAQEAFLEGGSDRKYLGLLIELFTFSSRLTTELSEALYFSTDDFARAKTTKKNSAHGLDLEIKSLEQEKLIKLMDKSILKDGVIEKQDSLPIPKSKNQLKKERQLKA
jgi:hypothetical protein